MKSPNFLHVLVCLFLLAPMTGHALDPLWSNAYLPRHMLPRLEAWEVCDESPRRMQVCARALENMVLAAAPKSIVWRLVALDQVGRDRVLFRGQSLAVIQTQKDTPEWSEVWEGVAKTAVLLSDYRQLAKTIMDRWMNADNQTGVIAAYINAVLQASEDPYARIEPVDVPAGILAQELPFQLVPVESKLVFARVPLEGPLAREGLKVGDVLVEFNGQKVNAQNWQTTLQLSSRATKLSLLVESADGKKQKRMNMSLRNLTPILVESQIRVEGEQALLHLRQNSFSYEAQTCDQVRDHWRRFVKSQKNKKSLGLIFDLRGNMGGDVEDALCVLGLFLGEKRVAYSRLIEDAPLYDQLISEGRPEVEELTASGPKVIPDEMPLVILVDSQTASSAELVAGVLQESGRAWLVGQRTYGKGISQEGHPYEMGQGILIYQTVARFELLSRRNYHGHGLVPDISISSALTSVDGELFAHRYMDEVGEVFLEEPKLFKRSEAQQKVLTDILARPAAQKTLDQQLNAALRFFH